MVSRALPALWALPALLAPVSTAVGAAEARQTPPAPLSVGVLEPEASHAAFSERFTRDGLVRFRLGPTQGLEDALRLVDSFLLPQGLHRNQMATERTNGKTLNPTNDTTQGSPQRIAFVNNHVLAPADQTTQGPHQEGATSSRNNRRIVVFYCEEPADVDGDTALFDMQRAWPNLPEHLQERLRNAHWGQRDPKGMLIKVPAAVRHEVTGDPCLQFYCFGKVARDCNDVYREKTGRYHVRADPFTYMIHPDVDLFVYPKNGPPTPFIGLDLYQLLSAIYDSMYTHHWQRGDVIVVDNVRFAHARLEGSGEKRVIRFFTYGPEDRSFDLNLFKRP